MEKGLKGRQRRRGSSKEREASGLLVMRYTAWNEKIPEREVVVGGGITRGSAQKCKESNQHPIIRAAPECATTLQDPCGRESTENSERATMVARTAPAQKESGQ